MPIGTYTVMDGAGTPVGVEEFRSSSGPFGWRYVGTIRTSEPQPHVVTVDLTADHRHRPVRVHIDSGSHRIQLSPGDDRLVGRLDGDPIDLPWDEEMHLEYRSPCFTAVTAAALPDTAEIDVVHLEPATLEPREERRRYERLGREDRTTPAGAFPADAWSSTAPGSGGSKRLWVAGLVVVAYEGLFELSAYEPGRTGPRPR